jgi:hypothetical protein
MEPRNQIVGEITTRSRCHLNHSDTAVPVFKFPSLVCARTSLWVFVALCSSIVPKYFGSLPGKEVKKAGIGRGNLGLQDRNQSIRQWTSGLRPVSHVFVGVERLALTWVQTYLSE